MMALFRKWMRLYGFLVDHNFPEHRNSYPFGNLDEKVIIVLVGWMTLLDLLSPSRKVRQDSEALRENKLREPRVTQRLEELGTLCFLHATQ